MNKLNFFNKTSISEKASFFICFSILIRTLNITISEILILDSYIMGIIKLIVLGLFIILDFYLFLNIDKKKRFYFLMIEFGMLILMIISMLVNDLGISLFTSYGWILISFIPILIAFFCLDDFDILFNQLYKFSFVYAFLCTLIYFFHIRSISTNLIFSYTLILPYFIQIVKYMCNKNKVLLLLILFETFMLFFYGSRGTIMCIIIFFTLMILKKLNKKQIIYLSLTILSFFVLYQIIYQTGFIRQLYLYFLNKGNYIRVLDLLSSGLFFDSNGRFDIYMSYFQYIVQKPFFGWGIGANLLFDYFPHNIIIEIIFNFGLFSIIIFYILFKLLKNYFTTFFKSDNNNLFLPFLCSGLLPLFFSSTYLEFMYFWIFFGFLIAVYKKSLNIR